MISLAGLTPVVALGIVIILLLAGVLVTLIRSRPALKKIAADREANLLTERAEEMEVMRKELKDLVARLDQKDKDHAAERAADRRLIEAERSIHRHEVGNLKTAFNSLLMLLKKGVAVEDAVAEVEQMRVEQLAREAAEKATLQAALIQGRIE